MKWTKTPFAALFSLLFLLASCEKPVFGIEDEWEEVPDGYVSVNFNVTHFEQIPFDNSMNFTRGTDVGNVCTRINLAVFGEEGKVRSINQTIDDDKFGQMTVIVPQGDYSFVILAHSCTGNATISKLEEIKFPNNKVTDTFYYYGKLTADGESSHDIRLKRAVAKFLLETEDNVPENVAELTFKYTGGSSTFDATSGYGCVNSRQTEVRPVTAEMRGKPGSFEIYTLPHEDEDELKITVTATAEDGTVVVENVFEKVPVKINQITRCKGIFFGDSNRNITLGLKAEDEWTRQDYQF